MFQAYLISCRMTGLRYVGITSRGLSQRWREHVNDALRRPSGKPLQVAIALHGEGAFTIEPLFAAFSYADLLVAERDLISQWDTRAPAGYNLSPGGQGCFGLKRSAETRALLARGRTGKRHTLATKARLSAARRGVSQNIGDQNGGAKLSLQQVRQIKRLLAGGAVQRQLASTFGISTTAIWKIARGLKWAHA